MQLRSIHFQQPHRVLTDLKGFTDAQFDQMVSHQNLRDEKEWERATFAEAA